MRILNRLGFKVPVIFTLFVLFLPVAVMSQIDGEKLFKTNCSACHTITDQKLIGPGLAGIEDRWEDPALLREWIKNSQSVLDKGDPYATALFEKFNKTPMPMQAVNDEEVEAILTYIANPPVVADAAPIGETVVAVEKEPSIQPWIILLGVVVLLYILMSLLRNLKHALVQIEAQKAGSTAPVQLSVYKGVLRWINANKTFFAVLVIIVSVIGTKGIWDSLLSVGVYQGYKPEQPVNFSHTVHAGTQKIDCNYCHSSARNSKTAGIPAANVCMNCHTYIQKGTNTGTTEIAKIYASIGFDPASQAYTAEKSEPLKWTKVHNLPDHVYFNHSQHVTVGKVACQTCHGPVETMDVLEQFAPLTMGWCVNCHRDTKVATEGNGYYDEMHARLPEELKEEMLRDGKLTVSELGGIECSKCHY
ncbi:MAG TPA: cytochrome C [Flavobacteriales bacterium]|nr:cytochrome C [Flavobacteriales bacterium]